MPNFTGLDEAEVRARRAAGKGNTAPPSTTRSYAQIVRENVFTFINNVLFALGIGLILLGRVSDALVSVGVVLGNMLVSVVQEIRAKRTLDRIALLTRPKATVVRGGVQREVEPAELVEGDLLACKPGDQIFVDGRIVGDGRIEVDESLLTGESDLVPKQEGDPVLSGSFCVTGSGYYLAERVGAASFANRLTSGARAFRRVFTPLQQRINLVVRLIVLIAAYFEFLLVIDGLMRQVPLVESVKMSVVIAGLVPNGLFLAIAAAYALGALRMAGQGALVQQSNAVESLSNVDVLCLDKTGTLTANRLQVETVRPIACSEAQARELLGAYAASTLEGNRTNAAILEACPGQARRVVHRVPFTSARAWSALAFDDPPLQGVYLIGAPESFRDCLILPEARDGLSAAMDEWLTQGKRVVWFVRDCAPGLTVAMDERGQPMLPSQIELIGALALRDELRPHASETLKGFADAGITLKIISGDNPRTVTALAQQAGLGTDIPFISGHDLSEDDPGAGVEHATVFGRITPQQKEKLIQALQTRGHYVAMIGDGVNDVLSLKRANLGIAMQSGTPATRGVADIILMDDSFAPLPYAFREGQRILNGMQDIFKLFLTRVLYAALLIASTGIVGGFPFAPKHNSLLTLLTVGLPSLALAAWAQPGLSGRKDMTRHLLHYVLPASITLGTAALCVYVVFYAAAPDTPAALARAQSALTYFSVLCGLLLIVFAEPPTPAWVGGDELSGDWRPTYLALALLIVFLIILGVPLFRDFFELTPLAWYEYGWMTLAAAAWGLALRAIWRMRILDRMLATDLGGVESA